SGHKHCSPPFNVIGPLISCLIFGVQSTHAVPFPRPHPWRQPNSINGKCANRKLSQPRGSPQETVPRIVPTSKPYHVTRSATRLPESLAGRTSVILSHNS